MVNGSQTAETTVTLFWDPPCVGQLWMNGRLLKEGAVPPYVATDLAPRTYTYGLFGKNAWAFSAYSVKVTSPFASFTNDPTASPTPYPTTLSPTVGEFFSNSYL